LVSSFFDTLPAISLADDCGVYAEVAYRPRRFRPASAPCVPLEGGVARRLNGTCFVLLRDNSRMLDERDRRKRRSHCWKLRLVSRYYRQDNFNCTRNSPSPASRLSPLLSSPLLSSRLRRKYIKVQKYRKARGDRAAEVCRFQTRTILLDRVSRMIRVIQTFYKSLRNNK